MNGQAPFGKFSVRPREVSDKDTTGWKSDKGMRRGVKQCLCPIVKMSNEGVFGELSGVLNFTPGETVLTRL
jgi:hypothetical protein